MLYQSQSQPPKFSQSHSLLLFLSSFLFFTPHLSSVRSREKDTATTMFSSAGGGGGEDTYTEAEVSGGTAAAGDVGKGGGIMLFGVRLMEEGTFRKSASMNNLALFEEQPHESNLDSANPGYASDDVVHPSARSRERKRGVPWTEEEHKLFLIGLQKVGKGDWRGISRNFVKTRTPTQVASHAQKYFLRRNNSNRRRRRSSLFDITTDAQVVSGSATFEDGIQQESLILPSKQHQNLISNLENYPMSALTPTISLATGISPMEGLIKGQKGQLKSTSPKFIRPVIPIPPSLKLANLNLNNTTKKSTMKDPLPLSLKISSLPSSSSSSSSPSSPEKQTPRHTSAFQAMPSNSFDSSGGDSIISVA